MDNDKQNLTKIDCNEAKNGKEGSIKKQNPELCQGKKCKVSIKNKSKELNQFKEKSASHLKVDYYYDPLTIKLRKAENPIHPILLSRRSIREMNGTSISKQTLLSLFEAVRWSPSFYNVQPWRLIYAERDSNYWNDFISTLSPKNALWASQAAVLIMFASCKWEFWEGKKIPVPTHTFDCGACWMSLAFEATARGLVCHAMEGFNKEKAAKVIKLNTDEYKMETMVAVGNRAKNICTDKITTRYGINQFTSEGIFKEKCT